MKKILAFALFSISLATAQGATLGSVDTEKKLLGSNSSIVVESMNDPEVQGMTCHISYARTGGIAGDIGLAEDPSRFSIACRQTGPLVVMNGYETQKEIKAFSRNVFFKEMKVTRMFDKENKTLIYLIHSSKLFNGSPYNAISSIPLMPWGTQAPVFK